MNSIKPICLSAFAVLVLAGCGAQRQVSSTSSLVQITAPLNIKKVAPLKENELKRWSHLDIVNDTIPGMGVDRAYSELFKIKTGVNVIVAVLDSVGVIDNA